MYAWVSWDSEGRIEEPTAWAWQLRPKDMWGWNPAGTIAEAVFELTNPGWGWREEAIYSFLSSPFAMSQVKSNGLASGKAIRQPPKDKIKVLEGTDQIRITTIELNYEKA